MKRSSLRQTIKLSDEQKKQIISEIKAFYLDDRGEEIGIIEEQQMENLSSDYYLLYRDV